jgi:hypothetical protein
MNDLSSLNSDQVGEILQRLEMKRTRGMNPLKKTSHLSLQHRLCRVSILLLSRLFSIPGFVSETGKSTCVIAII